MSSPDFLKTALWYAQRGIVVFPVRPREKAPVTRRGYHDATTDAAQIKAWWAEHPDANVGIPCAPNGLLVLDVDPRDGGDVTLGGLIPGGELPETPTADTGSGGVHILFRLPEYPVRGKAGPGIDVKANGYIVAAPSVHPSGGSYRWRDGLRLGEVDLAEVPPWAEEVIRRQEHRPEELHQAGRVPGEGRLSDAEVARRALATLRADRADDYDTWCTVGMACQAAGEELLGDWVRWSATSSKFPGDEQCAAKWRSFSPDGGVTLATLVAMAQEDDPGFLRPGYRGGERPTARANGHEEPAVGFGNTHSNNEPEPGGGRLEALVSQLEQAKPADRPDLVTDAIEDGAAVAELALLLGEDMAAAEVLKGRLRTLCAADQTRVTSLFAVARDARKRDHEHDDRRRDLALARAFAEEHRGTWLPTDGRRWYRYDNGIWVARPGDELRGLLWQFVDAQHPDGATLRTVASVTDAAETLTGWRVDTEALNANPMLVNVRNGVFDLEAGKLRPHDPALLQTVQRPFAHDPEATCPRWRQFIAEALVTTSGEPDTQLADLLQEWFGYCLVPTTVAHKACIWTGAGSNGKGVATGILTALVGEENTVATDIGKLDDDYKRANLRDKLLAVSSEVPSRGLITDAGFKAIVSGDLIPARFPYLPPFSFRPHSRILITCNELPATKDQTFGFFRRLIIMPWNATFDGPAVNPELEAELRDTELPGIFQWAVEGLARLVETRWRFTPADAASRTLEAYKLEGNSVALWVAEKTEPCDDWRVSTATLYHDYSRFCEDGNLKPIGISHFGRRLSDCAPVTKADLRTGKGWRGLRLLGHDGEEV